MESTGELALGLMSAVLLTATVAVDAVISRVTSFISVTPRA